MSKSKLINKLLTILLIISIVLINNIFLFSKNIFANNEELFTLTDNSLNIKKTDAGKLYVLYDLNREINVKAIESNGKSLIFTGLKSNKSYKIKVYDIHKNVTFNIQNDGVVNTSNINIVDGKKVIVIDNKNNIVMTTPYIYHNKIEKLAGTTNNPNKAFYIPENPIEGTIRTKPLSLVTYNNDNIEITNTKIDNVYILLNEDNKILEIKKGNNKTLNIPIKNIREQNIKVIEAENMDDQSPTQRNGEIALENGGVRKNRKYIIKDKNNIKVYKNGNLEKNTIILENKARTIPLNNKNLNSLELYIVTQDDWNNEIASFNINDEQIENSEIKNILNTVNYEDFFNEIGGMIRHTDKFLLKLKLRKKYNREPSEEEINIEAKKLYMEKLSMKDAFNKVKKNLDKISKKLIKNSNNIDINYINNNKLKIMLALTYLERQYNFSFNEVFAKDIILYNDKESAINKLINIGSKLNKTTLLLFKSASSYKNILSKYTGEANLYNFIESSVRKYVPNKTVDEWFKETSKAIIVESKNTEHNSSLLNKIKTEENMLNHLLPLLNLSEPNIYIISTTKSVNYGLVDTYVNKKTSEGKEKFNSEIIKRAKEQQEFLNFWYRISEKREKLIKAPTIIVIDTMQKKGNSNQTSQELWLDETGENSSSGIKEFISPMRMYNNYSRIGAQKAGNGFVHFMSKALTDIGQTTFTHEVTHILDKEVWFNGNGRRNGQLVEVFARGLFETINNTPGKSDYPPVFNLNLTFDLEDNNRIQNKTPNRFNTDEDMKEYMKGIMDVIYTLDAMEAKASLNKTPLEKSILFNKIELIPDIDTKYGTNELKRPNQVKDEFKHISEKEAKSLSTIDDLIDNSIVSGRLAYKGNKTIGIANANDYHVVPMFEPIYAGLQNNKGSVGDVTFRRYAYEILSEYGYKNGMLVYLSNKYENDKNALNAIMPKYDGNMATFKKAMFKRRIDNINKLKKIKGIFETPIQLQTLMNEAVNKDLEIMKNNKLHNIPITTRVTNVRNLKTKVYKGYFDNTNEFRDSIYSEIIKKKDIFEPIVNSDIIEYQTNTKKSDIQKNILSKITTPNEAGTIRKEIISDIPNYKGNYNINVKIIYDDDSFDLVTLKIKVVEVENSVKEIENLINFKRIAGKSRYHTAIEASKFAYKKSNKVILASGENYPDALVAGPLSRALNAPILLTPKSIIFNDILNEIERLSAKEIYMIGSDKAISKKVEKKLISKGYKIVRLAGNNRYETSIKVANYIENINEKTTNIVLARGDLFADAVIAVPYSNKKNAPIILTHPTILFSSIKNYLSKHSIKEITILGSKLAVSEQIENKLKEKNKTVKRISGKNRYDTAIAVAHEIKEDINSIILTDGTNYPDALVASNIVNSGKYYAPIITTPKTFMLVITKKFIKENKNKVKLGIIMGSNKALSDKVENEFKNILKK